MICAANGDGVSDLKDALAAAMPEGPWHLSGGPGLRRHRPDDRRRTDPRAALSPAARRSCPTRRAVETENWEDRKDGSTVIHQQILVERDSQKAIVIGKGGSRLKSDRRSGARGDRATISAARCTCSCT